MITALKRPAQAIPNWMLWALLLTGPILFVVGVRIVETHVIPVFWPLKCWFHAWTGLHCPGCGLTRMVRALAHGDLARAWGMNPLAMVAGVIGVSDIADRLAGRPAWWTGVREAVRNARTWAVVVIAFFVLRNLPWPIFSWMAPG